MPAMRSSLGEWFDSLEINRAIQDKDNMDLEAFRKLDRFAYTMKPKLDKQIWYAPIAYTPHDFSHHVKTVLENASKLLGSYIDRFSMTELLAIQYAIILHDIDMVYNPYGREKHSQSGANILDPFGSDDIDKKVKDILDNLYVDLNDMKDAGTITESVRDKAIGKIHTVLNSVIHYLIEDDMLEQAVGHIILGHSDIKIGKVARIDTLDRVFYQDTIPGGLNDHGMKTRVLAAVLRLADELDCSCTRKSGVDTSMVPPEARKYWDRLNLVRLVKITPPNIMLEINDNYIKKSGDRIQCFEFLKEVVDKIEQERVVVQKCFEEESFSEHLSEIRLKWNNRELENQYKQYLEDVKSKADNKKKQTINVDNLKQELIDTISKRKLFYDAHRRIGKVRVRNHLDCNGLLSSPEILDRIARAFINCVFTGDFGICPREMEGKKYVLVGVANSGALIAAHMAALASLPMIYYVPPQKEAKFSEPEKDVASYSNVLKDRKVVLITGISITGEAIEAASRFLEQVSQQTDTTLMLDAVVGLINRNDKCEVLERIKEKGIRVNFLLNGYPVEWCQYTGENKCPYDRMCKVGEEE